MLRMIAAALVSLAAFAATSQAEDAKAPTPPGSLSDKLDRTDGVIKPPADVDPKISKPAPELRPNSMPVIPPPGSPGGRQDVQPK
jgi:hypothetical protein